MPEYLSLGDENEQTLKVLLKGKQKIRTPSLDFKSFL